MTADPMTGRNSQLSSGDLGRAPAERETASKLSTLYQGLYRKLVTLSDWATGVLGRGKAYWVPPQLLTDPPASVAELSDYARRSGWTKRGDGPLRALGVCWFLFVALPWTTGCRYVEWTAQRPGRCLAAFVVWQTVIRSTPGVWAVDHIVNPILAAAAWVFLP